MQRVGTWVRCNAVQCEGRRGHRTMMGRRDIRVGRRGPGLPILRWRPVSGHVECDSAGDGREEQGDDALTL